MNSLTEIADMLRTSQRVVICGHVMPDGDSLGSVLALGLALEWLGKEVTYASHDPVPEIYRFMPSREKFLPGPEALAGDYDTFVSLDCSVPGRLGDLKVLLERQGLTTINIDHHTGFESYALLNYVDNGAAATGEIIIELLDLLQVPLSKDIAICLYVAIVTDTGSFQYENTTPKTLRNAARLLECGIEASLVNIQLFEEKPLASFRVLEAALGTLKISDCGRVAWIEINQDMLGRLNARDEHTDGLINYARMIRGVEVALFFREVSTRRYKVGFRSKGAVDVNRLAGLFGGGGHNRAAGCMVDGDIGEIKQKIIESAVREAEKQCKK